MVEVLEKEKPILIMNDTESREEGCNLDSDPNYHRPGVQAMNNSHHDGTNKRHERLVGVRSSCKE